MINVGYFDLIGCVWIFLAVHSAKQALLLNVGLHCTILLRIFCDNVRRLH